MVHQTDARKGGSMKTYSPWQIAAAAIAFAGLALWVIPTQTPLHANVRDFDGETLYRGLVQWRGPASGLVPEVKEIKKLLWEPFNDPYLRKHAVEIEEMHDRLLAEIPAIDPTFFDRFEAAVESGDHLAVQLALYEAGEITLKAAQRTTNLNKALRALSNKPGEKRRLAESLSSLTGSDFTTRDIDRMIRAISSGRSMTTKSTLVLAIVAVVVVAAYAFVALAQSVSIGHTLHAWLAISEYTSSPPATITNKSEVESLDFAERLNKGRLLQDRFIDSVTVTFAS
jgi:SdpC family antimicrobial peptide